MTVGVGIVIVIFTIWLISGRNKFIEQENSIKNAESKVLLARNKYIKAQKSALGLAGKATNNEGDVYMKIKTAGGAIDASDLKALGQMYPDLKDKFSAAANMSEKLLENWRIAQEELNECITEFNRMVSVFPSNFIAFIFKYSKQELVGEENLAQSRQLDMEEELIFSDFI